MPPEEYLDMIKPYLHDIINDHKTPMNLNNEVINCETQFGEWKVQLTMLNSFISSKILMMRPILCIQRVII